MIVRDNSLVIQSELNVIWAIPVGKYRETIRLEHVKIEPNIYCFSKIQETQQLWAILNTILFAIYKSKTNEYLCYVHAYFHFIGFDNGIRYGY